MSPKGPLRFLFLLCCLFALAVSPAAPQGSPSAGAEAAKRYYSNDRLGIKIVLPVNWELQQEVAGPPEQPLTVLLRLPGTLASVALAREVVEATPEIYERALRKTLAGHLEGYRELGEEKVSRAGLDGRRFVYGYKVNGVPLLSWMLIFSKGNNHFKIAAGAPEENFERYQSAFQEMLDSVELSDPATKAPSETESMASPTAPQYAGTTGRIATSPAAEVARLRARIAQNPNYWGDHMELGNALDDSGDTDAAIAEYKIALQLRSDAPQIHGNLGASYIRKENWDAAEAELREAVRLQPEYFLAYFRLVYVLEQKSDPEGAFRAYRELNRMDREQARALLFRDFPGVAQAPGAQQQIANSPPDAVAHFHIALELIRAKKACNVWMHELDEAVRLAPQFDFARGLRDDGRKECQ